MWAWVSSTTSTSRGRTGSGVPVALEEVVFLVHAAIDEDPRAVGFDVVLRPGNLPGGAEELKLHGAANRAGRGQVQDRAVIFFAIKASTFFRYSVGILLDCLLAALAAEENDAVFDRHLVRLAHRVPADSPVLGQTFCFSASLRSASSSSFRPGRSSAALPASFAAAALARQNPSASLSPGSCPRRSR